MKLSNGWEMEVINPITLMLIAKDMEGTMDDFTAEDQAALDALVEKKRQHDAEMLGVLHECSVKFGITGRLNWIQICDVLSKNADAFIAALRPFAKE